MINPIKNPTLQIKLAQPSENISFSSLQSLLQRYGKVSKLLFQQEQENQNIFAEFSDLETANSVLENLNGTEQEGFGQIRLILVSQHKEKQPQQ